jgi:hypothetical protein
MPVANIDPNPPPIPVSGASGEELAKMLSAVTGQFGGGGGSPGTLGLDYNYDPRRSGRSRRSTMGTIYDPYYSSPEFYSAYATRRHQSEQSRLQRQFQAQQDALRYSRFREFVDPLLSEYQSFLGGGGPQSSYDPSDPALLALEESIEQGGGEEQAELQSILAGSGNLRAGALGEASAKRLGRTRALVAGKRGEFAQAASDRDLREYEARLNSYTRLIQEALGRFS